MPSSARTPLTEQVREMYERDGMSTRRIAAALAISRPQVDRALREAGVIVAPRGAGRARPTARHQDSDDLADELRSLHTAGLTRRQISEKLGLTEGLVRTRLAEFGIRPRTRGRYNREDRQEPDVGSIERYYVRDRLSAQATGEHLDVSHRIVLRTAHDRGLPVRSEAATGRADEPVRLLNALYADPHVAATLERHDVPIVRAGAPIWQRFPEPVPLTAEILAELYTDCGVGITHIELLTGQPGTTIRRLLLVAGTPMRPAGGRSPFLRRLTAR